MLPWHQGCHPKSYHVLTFADSVRRKKKNERKPGCHSTWPHSHVLVSWWCFTASMFGLLLLPTQAFTRQHRISTSSVKIWSTSADAAAPFALIKAGRMRSCFTVLSIPFYRHVAASVYLLDTTQLIYIWQCSKCPLHPPPPPTGQLRWDANRDATAAVVPTCVETLADFISLSSPPRRDAFPDFLPRRGLQRLSHMSSSIS